MKLTFFSGRMKKVVMFVLFAIFKTSNFGPKKINYVV